MRRILLLVGCVLLLFLLWRLGPMQIVDALRRIGWWAVLVLLLGSAHHALRALALRACVVRKGVLRYPDALAIRLSGEAMQTLTVTGPVISQPTKAWLLERQGLSLQEGFAATVTEYLICAFLTAAMAIGGLLYLLTRAALSPALSVVAVILICLFGTFLIASVAAIACRFYLIGTIVAALARAGVLRGRLHPDMTWINRMEDLLLIILRDSPARFTAVVLIEVAAQALLVLELFWMMRALDLFTPILLSLVVESSIKVIGIAFLVVPLQLGVSEGAYATIFDAMNLPTAAGFAISFVRRIRTLAIAGIGLALLSRLSKRRPRHFSGP